MCTRIGTLTEDMTIYIPMTIDKFSIDLVYSAVYGVQNRERCDDIVDVNHAM